MVIYFMRHTAVDVPQGVCYGQTDVPLKPTFEIGGQLKRQSPFTRLIFWIKVLYQPVNPFRVRLATF